MSKIYRTPEGAPHSRAWKKEEFKKVGEQRWERRWREEMEWHPVVPESQLDTILGSGTTAVAAKLLNRGYIGIERSEKYYDVAKRRLSQQTLGI